MRRYFHGDTYGVDGVDDDHDDNDDGDDEFDIKWFYGDAEESYIDFNGNDDDLLNNRKALGNTEKPDIDYDCYYYYYYDDDDDDDDNYHDEVHAMRFHGPSKNYERVHHYHHHRGKYRGAAHSIRNVRYNRLK